jgi:hypothetical protein
MSQLLLEPVVLFFGFTVLSCAFCAACLFPPSDFMGMLRRIGLRIGPGKLRQ